MLPAALCLFYQKSEQTQTHNSLFLSYKHWHSLPLSASPHFRFSIILFVVLWILSSTTHTLFFCNFLCSRSRPPPSLSLTPSSLPPPSNRPILYELQLKMMSLIIWEEIMWLSFSLCGSAGLCVHAHVSPCARARLCMWGRIVLPTLSYADTSGKPACGPFAGSICDPLPFFLLIQDKKESSPMW